MCYIIVWGRGVRFRLFQCYEGVRSNAITLWGGGGVQFPGKKHYVTLKRRLTRIISMFQFIKKKIYDLDSNNANTISTFII